MSMPTLDAATVASALAEWSKCSSRATISAAMVLCSTYRNAAINQRVLYLGWWLTSPDSA